MTTYEMEIKKLKNSPMNFDSLFLKIQSEYQNREKEFLKIQNSF